MSSISTIQVRIMESVSHLTRKNGNWQTKKVKEKELPCKLDKIIRVVLFEQLLIDNLWGQP